MDEIEDYIAKQENEVQTRLRLIRNMIFEICPDVVESIQYKIPTYTFNKRKIFFAAFKKHIGMYPMYGLESIEHKIKAFRGKGTKDSIHFFHDKDLPLNLLKEIIYYKLIKE